MSHSEPLYSAIDNNDISLLLDLMNSSAGPNVSCDTCIEPCIPLLRAITRSNMSIISALLHYGADVNAVNSKGYGALHAAAFRDKK